MQRILIALALLAGLSSSAFAQKSARDSVRYYQELSEAYEQRMLDAARNADSGRLIASRLHQLKERYKTYHALEVFGEAAGADFTNFNHAIARDGFAPFTGPVWRIGLGVSRKLYNGLVFDFDFFIAGLERTQKSGDNKITTDFSNFFEVKLGYAVVNTPRFDLYPYAGLSVREDNIHYSTSATVNPNFQSIASLITTNQSAGANNYNLGYEAGLCAEYAVLYSQKDQAGTMLFARFGTDGSFGNENYHISGVDYVSGIKYGAWVAEFGFKFFMR